MANKYRSLKAVKATVKSWMENNQFVLVSKSWKGYEKVYIDAEEAVEDVGKYIFEFYLYNPNPPKEGRSWYCLHVVHNEYNDLWEIDKTSPNSKRPRKYLTEIQENWEAIKSGTYKKEEEAPKKTRKRKTVNLGEFLKENNITEEDFLKGDLELSVMMRISERMYNYFDKYTNFNSFFGAYGLNDFGHIITSDYNDWRGEYVVRHNAEGKCTTTIWYIDYQAAELYTPDNYKWEDLCELDFDDIKLRANGEILCYENKITDNDQYLKKEVIPFFIN